jgi:hypothetical protein
MTVTMDAAAATKDCAPVAASIEACAQGCFSSAIPKIGCALDDFSCQCGADKKDALRAALLPCVQTACEMTALPALITQAAAGKFGADSRSLTVCLSRSVSSR